MDSNRTLSLGKCLITTFLIISNLFVIKIRRKLGAAKNKNEIMARISECVAAESTALSFTYILYSLFSLVYTIKNR